MSVQDLILFLLITGIAGYFQTVTGFGLSMIIIGGASAFGLLSVATVVAIDNIFMVVNGGIALPGRLDHIDWRLALAILLPALPTLFAGVLLLDYLSSSAASLLRIILGGLVIFGGLNLILLPPRGTRVSGLPSFVAAGAVSGLFGGLFSVSGPPLIYQFYRQPLPLLSIRQILIVFFAITSAIRLVMIGLRGEIDVDVLIFAAWAVPMLAFTSFLGRRYPPPLSPRLMRGIAFVVLMVIGLDLIGAQLIEL